MNTGITIRGTIVVITNESTLNQLLLLRGGQKLAREGEVGVTDGDFETIKTLVLHVCILDGNFIAICSFA